MPLALEFRDKYRLWLELIRGNFDRVFVPFHEPLDIGIQAPVELALPGLPIRIVLVGTIVGRRRGNRRFPGGVYLRFSAREIDKCRAFLGLSSQNELFDQIRKSRRADCDLPLRFVSPALQPTGSVRNISDAGFRAIFPLPFHRGQRMRVAMQLEEGQELETDIEISWTKRHETVVGAKFIDLSPTALQRIENAIDRLLSARRQRNTKLILAADDDGKILEFLHRELGQQGFDVRAVRRGDDALSLARQLRPELIILEALLPGIDGVDVCAFMRADAEMADVPILMTSELDAESLHRLAELSGASDYLTKPIDLNELFRNVAYCLSPGSEG